MNNDKNNFKLFHLLMLSEGILSVSSSLLLRLLVNNDDRPKDTSKSTIKLPLIAYCLDQEKQGELIEMREFWYGDRPLNLGTHISVEIKTQQY